MQTKVNLKKWAVEENNDHEKGIRGEFTVNAGQVVIATQSFNSIYGSECKIPFPAEIMVDAEKLTVKIAAFITKHFTGQEE